MLDENEKILAPIKKTADIDRQAIDKPLSKRDYKRQQKKRLFNLAILIIILSLLYWYYESYVFKGSESGISISTVNISHQKTISSIDSVGFSGVPVTQETFSSTAYDFSFDHPSNWQPTAIFNLGSYQGSLAFVLTDQEISLGQQMMSSKADSLDRSAADMLIRHESADKTLFFRISNDTSINDIITNLYGSNVIVSDATVAGKNVAHVIYSKTSDPKDWSGISIEAYIIRNNIGQAIIIEADYSSSEPMNGGDLHNFLAETLDSFSISES